jgi:hypothetical protein
MTDEAPNEIAPVVKPKRRSPLRRIGCGILLVFWFALLLTPCFLITLAVQQEVRITTGPVPGQELRVWLIMEAETRGLGVSTGNVATQTETSLCLQTDIRYFLWQGSEAPVSYCECYQRSDASEAWISTTMATEVC